MVYVSWKKKQTKNKQLIWAS